MPRKPIKQKWIVFKRPDKDNDSWMMFLYLAPLGVDNK
jgi:hypothetical protein